jgi:outer membrane receptor protein involved in Fe transport
MGSLQGYLSGALVLIAAPLAGAAEEDQGLLPEVSITATRVIDTVNRVPISIQAVTQENLDRQGIKSSADLVRAVPGLSSAPNPGGAQQTFSIRGIVGGNGAATTSVYLDDTNLTKRANGGAAQNNGVITPLLYDLERVEILKGPQGTLYGGSSQGGTVRFITPLPNLSEYSGTARAELSTMGNRSELSNEAAAAFGGPIVQDKLGFRVSAIRRQTGGWVDLVSAYTNETIREDANSSTDWAVRGSLLWQMTEDSSAQLSAYHVDNKSEGGPTSQTAVYLQNQQLAGPNSTFTTQTRCITNNTRTTPLAQPGGNAGTAFFPTTVAPDATGQCPNGTVYRREGVTYGPFRTGKDISLALNRQSVRPVTSSSNIFGLSLNWNVAGLDLKSVTSYLMDDADSDTVGGEEWATTTPGTGQRTTADPARLGFPLFAPLLSDPLIADGNTGSFIAFNNRHGIEQELRLSSNKGTRLSWVAGAFFSHSQIDIDYAYRTDVAKQDEALRLMYGNITGPAPNTSPSTARYGMVNDEGLQTRLRADIMDEELALFAQGDLWLVPDRLRLTAGLRYSKVDLDYNQVNYGQFSGRLLSSNGTITKGQSTDKPLTPKLGLQYQFTDDKMIYASGAKGFRAGGVSPQIAQTTCQVALDNLGITAAEIPPAYKPDTVKSYELGGKFRLFNQLQVNAAAFLIDWNDVQVTTTLTCAQSFVANGGKARSKGGELSLEFQPLSALYLYLNASYTDAYYVDPVTGPTGSVVKVAPIPSLNAGDQFNVPKFSASGGFQYNFGMGRASRNYMRIVPGRLHGRSNVRVVGLGRELLRAQEPGAQSP